MVGKLCSQAAIVYVFQKKKAKLSKQRSPLFWKTSCFLPGQ